MRSPALSLLTLAIVLGATAAPALASHVAPADLGRYVDPGDETCFRDVWGAMRNDCPTARRFVIPIHTYWAGTQTAEVSVFAPDITHPVTCQVITAIDGNPYDIGAGLATSVFGVAEHLRVSADFFADQPGWVLCTVFPGARVNGMWFSGS
jgi:hypothetical protein